MGLCNQVVCLSDYCQMSGKNLRQNDVHEVDRASEFASIEATEGNLSVGIRIGVGGSKEDADFLGS